MKKITNFFGILGLVLFLFGLVGALMLGDAFGMPLLASHMIVGVLLIVIWVVTSGMQSLGSAGEVVLGRTAKFSISAFLYVVVFVAIIAGANYVAHKKAQRFDVTEEHIFSLSQQSKDIIAKLQKPLKLVGFKNISDNVDDSEVQRVLDLYRYENNSKVSYDIIDPRTKPFLVDKYEMKPGNVLYLQYGEDTDAAKGNSRINEFSEESITNAILKLTRGAARKIYIVQGHNEPGIQDTSKTGLKSLVDALKDENLQAEGIFLAEKAVVPEDAAALIVVSPTKSMPQAEQDMITNYVNTGGRALLLTDPQKPQDISSIADKFGITVGKDVVVDLVQRLFGQAALGAQVVARNYGDSPITRGFDEGSITIFNIASSLTSKESSKEITYTPIVKSGPSSWAETNLDLIFNADKPTATFDDGQDTRGPINIGISYEKKADGSDDKKEGEPNFNKVSRLVVFGDSDWVLNESLGSYANRDLLLNTINWLAGEEGGVNIRPKSMKTSIAPITRDQFIFILTSSLVVPELILIAGLFIWWRRRQAA